MIDRPAGRRRGLTLSCLAVMVGLLAGLAPGCTGPRRIDLLGSRSPLARSGLAPSQVELVTLEGRPGLAVLTREGDPSAVVSFVAFAPGDTPALVALGELLRARLERSDRALHVRVDREALLVDVDVDKSEAFMLIGDVRTALSRPVAPFSAQRARVDALLEALPVEAGAPIAGVNACLGQAGSARRERIDVGTAAGAARVEHARVRAFARSHVAFGVVGPLAVGEAVQSALSSSDEWPAAPPQAAGTEQGSAGALSSAEVAAGIARMTVAMRVADPIVAIAAAERLGRAPSPLGTRIHRHDFHVVRAAGVASPAGGGCVAVTLEGRLPRMLGGADRPFVVGLESVLKQAIRELRTEVSAGAGGHDISARIAITHGVRDASRMAAWWALSRVAERGPAAGERAIVALELPLDVPEELRNATDRAVSVSAVAAPSAAESGNLPLPPVRVRVEQGQTESWVLVANPCAASEEAPHRWGASALSALAARGRAAEGARALGNAIHVEPVADAQGVGFIAHGAPRADESAADLARALADVATASFFVDPATGDDLLAAEEAALAELGRRWGKGAPGLAGLGALLGDRPSLLEPFGPPSRVARFAPLDLARRLRSLAEGPVAIALLTRGDQEGAGQAAARAVARWVGPTSRTTCDRIAKPIGARSEVREPRQGPTSIHLVLPLELSADTRKLADAFAALLSGSEGVLEKTVAATPSVRGHARVVASGSVGRLLIALNGPDESVTQAERNTVALLRSLARGELASDDDVRRGLARAKEAARGELADPRNRLLRLFAGEALETSDVDATQLRAWMAKHLKPEDAIAVIARPE